MRKLQIFDKTDKDGIHIDFSIPMHGVLCKIEIQWIWLDRIAFKIISPPDEGITAFNIFSPDGDGDSGTQEKIVSHETFLESYWKYRMPDKVK